MQKFFPVFRGLLRCKSGKSVLVGMSIDRNERVFRRGRLNENVTVEKSFFKINFDVPGSFKLLTDGSF